MTSSAVIFSASVETCMSLVLDILMKILKRAKKPTMNLRLSTFLEASNNDRNNKLPNTTTACEGGRCISLQRITKCMRSGLSTKTLTQIEKPRSFDII